MLLDRILSFFTSLRLTVACLGCALVLVFAGTLAQVNLGLYVTQAKYFHSLLVFWTPEGSGWRIPVWPGGYLIGGVLLVNLIAAHAKRFSLSWKKSGLFMIHAGLILLFLGQFFTETFQVESFMRLEEGQTRNYTESARKSELAVVDVSNPDRDVVVTIPESSLAGQKQIQHPDLPFTIQVKDYFANSSPAPAMASVAGNIQKIQATQGIGQRLHFQPRETTTRMDAQNVPSALIEIQTPQGSLGSWTVSDWFTRDAAFLNEILGGTLSQLLSAPQEFTYQNKTYRLAMRPVRYYKPYSIGLIKFTHARYKGTDIPKDFSSKIHLRNTQTGENRDVDIYMNNPLRYAGETFYQAGFDGETTTILQVVRNPAWLTPYVSCALVGLGLAVHFVMSLVKFAKKTRNAQAAPVGAGARPAKASGVKARPKAEAAIASVAGAQNGAAFHALKRRNT